VYFAQQVHLPFRIPVRVGQAALQVAAEGRPVGGHFQQAGVQQFIEQDRVAVQVGGGPGGGADDVGHLLQSLGVLLQQGQIGAPAGDVFQEIQAPGQD